MEYKIVINSLVKVYYARVFLLTHLHVLSRFDYNKDNNIRV